VATAEKSIAINEDVEAAAPTRERLQLYRSGKPFPRLAEMNLQPWQGARSEDAYGSKDPQHNRAEAGGIT